MKRTLIGLTALILLASCQEKKAAYHGDGYDVHLSEIRPAGEQSVPYTDPVDNYTDSINYRWTAN